MPRLLLIRIVGCADRVAPRGGQAEHPLERPAEPDLRPVRYVRSSHLAPSAKLPVAHLSAPACSDACIDWETTVKVLNTLRSGVQARRKLTGGRRGIDNRALATASERASSVNGHRDFNDPNFFPAA